MTAAGGPTAGDGPKPTGSAGAEDLILTPAAIADGYAISQRLTRIAIGLGAGELLMLHAAGLVPRRDGHRGRRAVGIVAASGTGKTTFCQRLADSFDYLTDETLGVEPGSLRVRPYPKPLSLVGRGGRKLDRDPGELGLTAVGADGDPVTLGAVVIAERVEEGMSLEPLGLAEAIGEVVPQSSSLYDLAAPLRVLAEVLSLSGGPWRLRFSDQAECGEVLAALAAGDVEAAVACAGGAAQGVDDHARSTWRHHPGGVRDAEASPGARGDDGTADAQGPALHDEDVLARAPWTDAVESEGMVALLSGRQVNVLGGAGAAAWLACDRPRPLREIHDAVSRALGEHPDSPALMRQTLASLLQHRILRPGSIAGRRVPAVPGEDR
ncbi:hypothetical protein [Actinomyces sp. MRS3W]|uniref:hypothetical protein n=1 Tax=Actinomyces sp. MRS3W TaxID=2800796 RepID=UPI0028FD5F7C|nr:hypothetical protein [Actinomyces sp. MRS3W]MDU0348882.1 hypothetical protein [Actinomyces sp. MRS3W]